MDKDRFPVLEAQDLDDALVNDGEMEEDDADRFREARDGDHLLCPFVCDDCWFWKLKYRCPEANNQQDLLLQMCIRRASLDAFWARERTTVSANRREGIRFVRSMELVGILNPFPNRGPWPESETMAMKVAVSILIRSLDPGRNSKNVQFETIRKLRSHIANFYHTIPGGMGSSFISDEGVISALTNSPTNTLWFRRFMKGMHKRMGDVWIPDRPLTVNELKACFELLEQDWDHAMKKSISVDLVRSSSTAVMFIAGFFAALRGEEILKVDIGAMRKNWSESLSYPQAPHVPLMLAGRFKREIGEKLFCQPLCILTRSGINIASWFHRFLWILYREGQSSGPAFISINAKGTVKRANIGDLDLMFHDILKRVQKTHPNLLPPTVNISEEFSASRSFRRGATSEAQNVGLPREVIEANNRWRKTMRAKGLTPGLSMLERYTDAKASVPALIRFSSAL